MRTPRATATITAALALACALVLTGCTGDDEPEDRGHDHAAGCVAGGEMDVHAGHVVKGGRSGDASARGGGEVLARDDDVVLESPGCSYEVNGGVPTSRIATFTGVPTVIGWTNVCKRLPGISSFTLMFLVRISSTGNPLLKSQR